MCSLGIEPTTFCAAKPQNLIDFMVSSIQKSHKRKKIKGWDVHMFFVEEIKEAVSSLAKVCQKWKIRWIFEWNVWLM